MSDNADLTVALKAQNARDNDHAITTKLTKEIKSSLAFQYNWADLLQSAPVAVLSAGTCYVACSGEAGMQIKLEPPSSGHFKFIDATSFSDAMITCGDLGKIAFVEAEMGMDGVMQQSKNADIKVADIIELLASSDPHDASTLLKGHMDTLKITADNCLTRAVAMDQKFENWLMYTMELYSICVGMQSSDEEKLKATAISLVVEQTRFNSQTDTVKQAKATSEKLSEQLNVASKAFKKASDNFPSGWDILGQQIVGALADCATTALSQVMTAYTSNLNPIVKATSGMSMFDDLIYPNKPNSGGTGPSPQQPPPPAKAPVPATSQDPAYSSIQKDMPYINTLHILLTTGTDGGVNWDEASGSFAASQSAEYIHQMLQDAVVSFESLATTEQPSSDLREILNNCVNISQGMVTEAKKGTTMRLKADSADVKDWQAKFQSSYAKAQKMVALAKALPGGVAAGVPVTANTPDPNEAVAKTNAKSAQAQAILEAARNRFSTTQDCFTMTQALYAENNKILEKQETQLTAAQAELKKINETKMGLGEVKAVLESCIKLIVNVKTQIMNLVSFFKAISASIEDIVTFIITPFIEQITAIANGAGHTQTIGPFTLTDYQRTLVYSSTVMIRSHFSVFGDIAQIWVRFSIENIKDGLKMMDDLSTMEKDLAKRQAGVRTLQQWADQAIDRINKFASTAQDKINSDMLSRVEDVRKTTKQIPASEPMRKAIEAGTGEVQKAASDAIQANAAAKPLNRFAPKQV